MPRIYCLVVMIMVIETAFSSEEIVVIRTNSDAETGSLQNAPARKNSWNKNVPKFRLDYKYVAETGYYYKTHHHTQSYSVAVAICKSEGAELATPKTQEEAAELIKHFKEGYDSVWIGIHDIFSERYYQTLDGEPANEAFVNWSPGGYPSIICDCHCVIMNNKTLYYNLICDNFFFFVCARHISTIGNRPTYDPYGYVFQKKPSDRQNISKNPTENRNILSETVQLINKSSLDDEKTLPTEPHPPKFRNDYTYVAESGYYYKAHVNTAPFKKAVSICAAEGAQLATPKTKSEAATLIKQFRYKERAHWVGIHDLLSEGDFITLDGVPVSEIYINWQPQFPEPNKDDNDCVIIGHEGAYWDRPCIWEFYFICTKHESTIHTNILCDTYDNDNAFVYNSEADRCYKLHTIASTWKNGMKICRMEQSNLVEINSAAEAKLLTEIFKKSKGFFNDTFMHIDFNSLLMPDTYVSSSTKTLAEVGYEAWADDEPNNKDGNERCGGMLMNGKLADVNCDTKALFICEKVPGSNKVFSQSEPDFTGL